jgi:2-polyprenyl-3-methyl-5-hydroxy-6-metoxy-1,4-benzoquinol methylase
MPTHEKVRLENIAASSLYSTGLNTASIIHSFKMFERHMVAGDLLELGPAEGVMTELLNGLGRELTLVEGSSVFCESLRARFPRARVEHSLFEEWRPTRRFANIILGHVLEHVEDPVATLRSVGNWLAPGGRVLAAVPNARSLHRQAAVIMGLLSEESQLNDMDRHHGHRRVFDPESFRATFVKAGLRVETFGGYWLKPLSNAQLESQWTPVMVDAFMQLGERYPDIAAEVYVVASRPCP